MYYYFILAILQYFIKDKASFYFDLQNMDKTVYGRLMISK